MIRYKIKIAYDGTRYHGWQRQPFGRTIQEEIEKCLATIFQEKIHVVGAGRTDKGAHALGQFAHFDAKSILKPSLILYSLNQLLPFDIRILEMSFCPPTFHARFSAIGKIYHYLIAYEKILSPFYHSTHLHIPDPIDVDIITLGAKKILGLHDFTSFTNKGSSAKNMYKHLRRISCIKTAIGINLEFEGDGFLYKMVRNIVGTLIALGKGKIHLEDLSKILEGKDRRLAQSCVSAHALFLMQVQYRSSFEQTTPYAQIPLPIEQKNLSHIRELK